MAIEDCREWGQEKSLSASFIGESSGYVGFLCCGSQTAPHSLGGQALPKLISVPLPKWAEEVPGAGRVHWAVPGVWKTRTQEERGPAVPAPPGRRRGPLPHQSHLQRKTWGPGAAASGGICRSPARRRARPEGGAGSAPPPRCLPPPSLPFLGPRAPSSSLLLLHPSPTRFVCPSRCDWLGGSAAPAPRGRRGRKPRLPPEAAEGNEIRGPRAALHLDPARGGCLCTPSRGLRGLASPRGGGVPPLVTVHSDLDVCSSPHCFACVCDTAPVCTCHGVPPPRPWPPAP
uniref:WAS/WASL-interacting protein family member 3-like n=1 Tax=Halichoerus grypus TaxID=9711 RepID=UPI001658DB9D|nr:WAS/WASL-interacting protein family member 3-like [Halichoerus grypus]